MRDSSDRRVLAGSLRDPIFLSILAFAVLLRAATAYGLPSIAFADEAFQYIEQAYRLLTGRGQVPWEYSVGVRSWLLPLMALPPVAIGRAVSASPDVWYGCVTAMMIALSVVPVVGAYLIGCKAGSRSHGLWAAFLTAIWCESIYYSAHFLADSLGAIFLIGTLAVAVSINSWRGAAVLGALLGATFVVRMQLGPALFVIALASCWREPRTRLPPVAAGCVTVLAVAGAVDWITWGAPFRSLWMYFQVNRLGVAESFGTKPAYYYLVRLGEVWTWLAAPIFLTALLGARRAPLLFAVTILTIAAFSIVPHKEYRFVYPAVAVLFILAGIGTAELASDLGRLKDLGRLAPISLATGWVLLSTAGAANPETRLLWLSNRGTWQAMTVINHDPQSCGVAVWPRRNWVFVPRSRLRDDLDLFRVPDSNPAAFNYVLAYGPRPSLRGDFESVRCYGLDGLCLWRRPGPCTPSLGTRLVAEAPPKTITALREILPKYGTTPAPWSY